MKVAITYDKQNNTVFQHFGKTEYFYLFNTENNASLVLDNGGYSHHELVEYLKKLGVDAVICGGCGNHAIEFLNEEHIQAYPGITGNVDDVVREFKKGNIKPNMNAVHSCSHN